MNLFDRVLLSIVLAFVFVAFLHGLWWVGHQLFA